MKTFTLPFILLIVFAGQLLSQQIVVDQSEISNSPVHYLADVDGKVLIDENYLVKFTENQKDDSIVVWPNWPQYQIGESKRGGIYCNMDSDPELEIIYCVSQKICAWNIDGSFVNGWPVNVPLYPNGAPAFGDIDGDGEGEVVISTRTAGTGNSGQLHAFEKDGTQITGFPVTLNGGATKTPVLADLDGDNSLEVIIEERDYPDGYVGVYKGDGTTFP